MSHLSKPHSNRAPATLLHVGGLHGVLGKTAAYWWDCHWPWCLCSRENDILIILDVIRFSSLDFVNWVEGETLYLGLPPVSFYEVQADLSFIQQSWQFWWSVKNLNMLHCSVGETELSFRGCQVAGDIPGTVQLFQISAYMSWGLPEHTAYSCHNTVYSVL